MKTIFYSFILKVFVIFTYLLRVKNCFKYANGDKNMMHFCVLEIMLHNISQLVLIASDLTIIVIF